VVLVAAVVVAPVRALGASDAATARVGTTAWFVTVVAYAAWFEGRGWSLGKRALRLRIVCVDRDAPPGPLRAVGRRLLWILCVAACAVPALVCGLWPLWDPIGQALHDRASGTLVVDR
jgi:uncharacterized RDD family membrane protein YckC